MYIRCTCNRFSKQLLMFTCKLWWWTTNWTCRQRKATHSLIINLFVFTYAICMFKINANHCLTFAANRGEKKVFGAVPVQDLISSASERVCHRELQSAPRSKTGALHRPNRDFLLVKSEELRSSTIPLNELCLTSLFGALLPHPPPPVSPLFVPSAWECQLSLAEDAAYTVPLFLSVSPCDPLYPTQSPVFFHAYA